MDRPSGAMTLFPELSKFHVRRAAPVTRSLTRAQHTNRVCCAWKRWSGGIPGFFRTPVAARSRNCEGFLTRALDSAGADSMGGSPVALCNACRTLAQVMAVIECTELAHRNGRLGADEGRRVCQQSRP